MPAKARSKCYGLYLPSFRKGYFTIDGTCFFCQHIPVQRTKISTSLFVSCTTIHFSIGVMELHTKAQFQCLATAQRQYLDSSFLPRLPLCHPERLRLIEQSLRHSEHQSSCFCNFPAGRFVITAYWRSKLFPTRGLSRCGYLSLHGERHVGTC